MLTVSEAATVLRVSRSTAYKLIQEHHITRGARGLPHVRLGARVMVRRVDLAVLIGIAGPA
jgi:Helix-turn-helix domain